MFIESTEFQTPPIVCDYMASLVKVEGFTTIFEPTPGIGNLVSSLQYKGHVFTPEGDFWDTYKSYRDEGVYYDYVVMNPPFTPVAEGWRFLEACLNLSNNVIALIPWVILINSESRMKKLTAAGLKSITHIPRKTFPGSRIQCCIVEIQKEYADEIILKDFTW